MSEYNDLLRKYVTSDLNYNSSANFVTYQTPGYGGITYPNKTQENRVNLSTKVVQLKAGYVGQVLHGYNIVWESKPKKSYDKAVKAADKAKDRAVARLFEEN